MQQGITELGQVRIGINPWENHALLESQAAIYDAPRIKTPFLILHGTDDGSVDWPQGLMFYNQARKAREQRRGRRGRGKKSCRSEDPLRPLR